jgi:hypothetical protein
MAKESVTVLAHWTNGAHVCDIDNCDTGKDVIMPDGTTRE